MTTDARSIAQILADTHTIAVVGLSAKTDRASHQVAYYLQSHGYRIIPVNPTYAGTHILGEPCFSTLAEAAASLAQENIRIDLVDCFRRAEAILPIADAAIQIGAAVLWMQLGISNQAAAAKAEAAGLTVVMDRCLKIEHARRR
ncbi:CoA-binding protein [Undibacterium arcticum]|uniref:CoA-binding protein n=1 Tax=Undibacterium arcticum TaxID=1762892 RepID=A0ABV7F0N8_9BURK